MNGFLILICIQGIDLRLSDFAAGSDSNSAFQQAKYLIARKCLMFAIFTLSPETRTGLQNPPLFSLQR